MDKLTIEKLYIYSDVIISILMFLAIICFTIIQDGINYITMIVIGCSLIPFLYHFATLLKCYRYDKHTVLTVCGNSFDYSNDNAMVSFVMEDVSEYVVYSSSYVGLGYRVIRLRNNQCIYLTDLMDSKVCSKLFQTKAKHKSDVFLVNLPRKPSLSPPAQIE